MLPEGFLASLNKSSGLTSLFVASKYKILERVYTFFSQHQSWPFLFFPNNRPFYETVCGILVNFLNLFQSFNCAPLLTPDIVTYGFYSRLNWVEVCLLLCVHNQLRNASRISSGIYQICHYIFFLCVFLL